MQEELMEKFDKETRTRKFTSKQLSAGVYWLAICIALYHFITSAIGYPSVHMHRSLHVAMMLTMAFLLYPSRKRENRTKLPWYDVLLILLSISIAIYIWIDWENFINRMGSPNTLDIIMGTLLIFLVMEAARRVAGWSLVILSMLFLLYTLIGRNMPSIFMHRGYDWGKIVNHCFINTEGIYGISVGVAGSYIFLFILFGSVMNKSGMGQFFNDIALSLAGASKGGPAKVAVIASGFLGSINGSAVANVVTTGTFTIPLMKKTGYSDDFAGAVEATASVGGQLLPPVMGAAAFIMAETLGIKYSIIIKSAIIPALLYYIGILVQVQLRANKLKLMGIPKENLLSVKEVMKAKGHLLIPIMFLLYMLLFSGKTVIFSAFWTIIVTIAISFIRKETRMSFKDLLDAFVEATRSTVSVAIACAVVGIIIGVVSLTGFGLNMADAIIELGKGNLFFTLILTMIACMILGMGLPSIPAYLITATIAAPALVQLGVEEIAAHLFVFYFAMFANITPPVALASFAAAGISGGNPMKTGIASVKLSLAGFMIPYMFIYNTGLLLIGVSFTGALIVSITSILGVFLIGMAVEGYYSGRLNPFFRIASLIGAVMLINANRIQDLIGIGILISIISFQHIKNRQIKIKK